jgi:hypothetical protein
MMLRAMLLSFFLFCALPLPGQVSGLTGKVTDAEGKPLSGVHIYGTWRRLPTEADTADTDSSGCFHLEHRAQVIHFYKDGFAPTSYVTKPDDAEIRIVMNRAGTIKVLPRCKRTKHGHTRIGSGLILFDVPKKGVQISGGKPDTDYVLYIVKLKGKPSALEFWIGVYAISSDADEQILESTDFQEGEALCPDSMCGGYDSKGHLPTGNRWRKFVFVSQVGAIYRDASPEEADRYDRMMDSVCVQYYNCGIGLCEVLRPIKNAIFYPISVVGQIFKKPHE